MPHEFFEGDDAQSVFLKCEVSIQDVIEAKTLHEEIGLGNYQGDIALFKNQSFLDSGIVDKNKFDDLFCLKIETKFNYSNGPEYWESIKLISLNDRPFIILIIQGDSVMEHVIEYTTHNLFTDAIKNCLLIEDKLTENDIPDSRIIKF
jgi:hypothetical protein